MHVRMYVCMNVCLMRPGKRIPPRLTHTTFSAHGTTVHPERFCCQLLLTALLCLTVASMPSLMVPVVVDALDQIFACLDEPARHFWECGLRVLLLPVRVDVRAVCSTPADRSVRVSSLVCWHVKVS